MVTYFKATQAAYLMQVLVAENVKITPINIIWLLSLLFFAYLALKGKFPVISWFGVIIFSRQMLYFLDLTYGFFQKLQLYLVPAQRYFETIDIDPEITHPLSAKNIVELQGKLEFDKVDFSSQTGFPILKNISLNEKQNLYHHQIGTFMRGYYSEIDGSLQGYALFTPDIYDRTTPFPLVINHHGYDPSLSS